MKPFESRGERFIPVVLGVFFGVCAALLVVSIVMFYRTERRDLAGSPGGGRAPSQTAGEERASAIVEATRRVSPAVVSVTAIRTRDLRSNPELYYRWLQQFYFNPALLDQLGGRPVFESTSFGSGLIISPDGYVLTNEHVTRQAESIVVTMSDGTRAQASVTGSDALYDVALLKIEARNLPYAILGDSDRLSIGEWVIAIGSPFGYLLGDAQPSVTVGVVSALHRDVKSLTGTSVFQNMIQTDAAINPGNSGGPLVSSAGEVIGINTFIFTTSEGNVPGMSFAIPINTSKMVTDELLHYGRVRITWTGIGVSALTPDAARRLGLAVTNGLLVEKVEPSSPGAQAGIVRGDVILEVNGSKVGSAEQAARAVFGLRVGDTIEIVVSRGGKTQGAKLRLAELPKGT
ncbi:MAG TPA: trypsin-like peptidase domain-containing protein [Candidatus Bathyarchaeia archaeon]|nr:trypsin-like peptidase domain-containing protein [Candidatus Bathyarchaeia archaeon]